MTQLVVYTCITAEYDWLLPPLVTPANIRYLCFSDTAPGNRKGWTVLPIPKELAHLPANMVNRYLKLFPHRYLPEYEWSIYIDGNLRLLKDPTVLVHTLQRQGNVIACPGHPDRQNIYQEAEFCQQRGKFTPQGAQLIHDQIAFYHASGMPARQRLTENNFIIRKHTDPGVQRAMACWWEQLERFTQRDQISFPYVIWKTGLPLCCFAFAGSEPNGFIKKVPHRKARLVGLRCYVRARQADSVSWRLLESLFRLAARTRRFFYG